MTTEDFKKAKILIESIEYINDNIRSVKHINSLTQLRISSVPCDKEVVFIPDELALPIMELMLKYYNKILELLEKELNEL